jgi:pimeloyl-ACP methyl ester carboxylesterase
MRSCLITLAALGLLAAAGRSGRAEEGSFQSNGVKIRYITEGKGEAVVLIHGFTGSAEMWGKTPPNKCAVWEKLAKQYRVIALDCRGHGKSDKPHDPKQYGKEHAEDVVRLLDHLKIKKAHVVGYSMGSIIAGTLCVSYPDRILRVVCGGGVPLCEPNKELLKLTDLMAKSLDEGKGLAPVILAATSAPGRPKVTPEVAKIISDVIIGKQDQKALAACVRGNLKLEVTPDQLKANKLPVLVVYGSKEGDGDDAVQKEFKRIASLMGAKVQVIEGSDHVSTIARAELADAIVVFLKEHGK